MPNAKRASMREGPLAQLFRKTAEDTAHEAKPPVTAPEPVEETKAAKETKPAPAAEAAATQRALPHPSLHLLDDPIHVETLGYSERLQTDSDRCSPMLRMFLGRGGLDRLRSCRRSSTE